jgi:hypothetical protein
MDAASDPQTGARGEARLLTTMLCLSYVDDIRPSACERLERVVGEELARFLLGALSGRDHRTRPRDLVA